MYFTNSFNNIPNFQFFFYFYIQHDKIIERERRWGERMKESKSREEKEEV